METPHPPEDQDKSEKEDQNEEDPMGELFEAYAEAVDDEDIAAQEAAALKVWEQFAEIEREPSEWLMALGEAHECEAAFNWIGAEEAYKRAIAAEPDNPALQSSAWEKLGALFDMVGLDTLAFEAVQTATRIERKQSLL